MTGRNALILVLVISITVNLLLVGGIVGRIMTGPPPAPVPDHLGWVVRLLDDERRQELRQNFRALRRDTRSIRTSMRADQREFEAAMAAEPFDEPRLTRALDALRSSSLQWQAATHKELVNIMGQLTPEERERVVEFLNRRDRRPDEQHRQRP